MSGPKTIHGWPELAEVEDSPTHSLDIDVKGCNGWIISKETGEHEYYLSTHTFYGSKYRYSTALLERCGFNVEITNWDA